MEPALHSGDLAVLHRHATYEHGDVIGFAVQGGQVIHRIVGGSADEGYITQGDNKESPDPWRPKPENISGAMWLRIPRAGRVLAFLGKPLNAGLFALLVGIAVTEEGTRRRARGRRWLARRAGDGAGGSDERVRGHAEVTELDAGTEGESRGAPSRHSVAAGYSATLTSRERGPRRSHVALRTARVLLVCAGLLTLGLASLCVYSYRQPLTRTDNVVLLRYENTGTFTYSIRTASSSLYPSGLIGPVGPDSPPDTRAAGNTVLTRLAQILDLRFSYQLRSTGDTEASGEIGAVMEIASGEAWTKTFELMPPQPFGGTTADAHLSVSFPDIISFIQTVEAETGVRVGSHQIRIVPTVRVEGIAGERRFETVFSPPFTMQLTDTKITLDPGLERSEAQTEAEQVVREAEVRAVGFSAPVGDLRRLSQLGAGVTGALSALLAAIVYGGLGLSEADRARARYRSLLVEASSADFGGARHIRMASIADLARLAERDGQVMCELVEAGRDLFFVHYGQVVYTYEVPRVSQRS